MTAPMQKPARKRKRKRRDWFPHVTPRLRERGYNRWRPKRARRAGR